MSVILLIFGFYAASLSDKSAVKCFKWRFFLFFSYTTRKTAHRLRAEKRISLHANDQMAAGSKINQRRSRGF